TCRPRGLGDVNDRRRDLLRTADPAEWDGRGVSGTSLAVRQERRVDRPRSHHVDPDLWSELACERPAEPDERRFGRHVRTRSVGPDECELRRDEDDRALPAAPHLWGDRAREVEGPAEVDPERSPPVLVCHILQGDLLIDAGVRYGDRDGP